MTAEIIIMNTGAVAMAADSAVTSTHDRGREKIFSSENKIFELTDDDPVGIMTYGSAEFMSIPWDTVIKEYRRRHGRETHPRLRDYMDAFIRFLREEIGKEITTERQESYVVGTAHQLYEEIANAIQQRVMAQVDELTNGFESTIQDMAEALVAERPRVSADIIDLYHQLSQEATVADEATAPVVERGRHLLEPLLPELRESFEADIGEESVRKLDEIAYISVGVMSSDLTQSGTGQESGIVLAGFGEEELFPGYINVEIDGLFGGMLKWAHKGDDRIAVPPRAAVAGFAQTDLYMLMGGIQLDHLSLVRGLAEEQLVEYTTNLVEGLTGATGDALEKVVEQLRDEYESVAEAVMDKMIDSVRGSVIDETLDVVGVLPKEQLGEMAEALINFTSLRRRVSLDDESVGGPTDVALISKGDGFVWIKRKQYFEPGLNPEYFARIYGKGVI